MEYGNDRKIKLPKTVDSIIKTLQNQGYEAYAVGGCVRDSILLREPEDWDITTSATPEQTKALFRKTFDTGIEHGTVTILMNHRNYEVTTYRLDGKYEDNRHPKEVTFTRSLKEDLKRRDFTINAMAYNEQNGLMDLFGGLEDLQNNVIRCVGDPNERFSEDALRMLRAIRFAAQLGFDIEEKTQKGIHELAFTLVNISAERIQSELVKLLSSKRPALLRKAYQLGVTEVILPEFNSMMETEQETPHHMFSVGEHTLKALEQIKPDKILRLAVLFHDMGKPAYKTMDSKGVAHFKQHAVYSRELAERILRRLKFDNYTLRQVTNLVYYHEYRMPPTARNVRKAVSRITPELFPMYLEIRKADVLAQSEHKRKEKLKEIEEVSRLFYEITRLQQCVTLKDLAVNGSDLLTLGIPQGKAVGAALKKLLDEVLKHPENNTREKLMSYAKDMK